MLAYIISMLAYTCMFFAYVYIFLHIKNADKNCISFPCLHILERDGGQQLLLYWIDPVVAGSQQTFLQQNLNKSTLLR